MVLTQGQRAVKVTSLFLCAGAFIFTVLFADFGDREGKEHCYTPIRKWYQAKKLEFFTLSEDERKEVEYKIAAKARRDA